jgi:hypothetical protein
VTPRIIAVEPRPDFKLRLTLSSGEQRDFDCTPYLERGIFKALKDVQAFQRAYVAFGTVCWPGELDLAPETLLARSVVVPAGGEVTAMPR